MRFLLGIVFARHHWAGKAVMKKPNQLQVSNHWFWRTLFECIEEMPDQARMDYAAQMELAASVIRSVTQRKPQGAGIQINYWSNN